LTYDLSVRQCHARHRLLTPTLLFLFPHGVVCIVQSDTRPSRKRLSWRDCCWVLTSNSLRQNKLTTSLVYTHVATGVTVVGPRCRLDPKFEIGSVLRCRLQRKKCLSTARRNSSRIVVRLLSYGIHRSIPVTQCQTSCFPEWNLPTACSLRHVSQSVSIMYSTFFPGFRLGGTVTP
jgi:hypothetical protein